MIVIRPLTKNDSEAFAQLAFSATSGIRSLPKNHALLQKKVESSLRAFKSTEKTPQNEHYFFVLEDLASKSIGGTCGIASKTGVGDPLYFYRIETIKPKSKFLPLKELSILLPVSYVQAPSEICALYLSPEFRREGLGRLLSLSRFLFIASHPSRFESSVFAEMRGLIDKNDISPFWEGIGREFLDIEFIELMNLIDRGVNVLPDILPQHPLYISLLKEETQDSISKIHPDTRPALNMLLEEGFRLSDEIDVFDGGPKIEAKTTQIRSIKDSIVAELVSISRHPIESPKYIISNNRLNFRACFGTLQKTSENGIVLPSDVAAALEVELGDFIRYVAPSGTKDLIAFQERVS